MSAPIITTPIPNTPELVAVYQYIVANPQEWNQDYWATKNDCGTAFCFAGHAAARAGYQPDWTAEEEAEEASQVLHRRDYKRFEMWPL